MANLLTATLILTYAAGAPPGCTDDSMKYQVIRLLLSNDSARDRKTNYSLEPITIPSQSGKLEASREQNICSPIAPEAQC
jgi:hypothetical protein